MRQAFIFTSLGVVRGESKRGNRKCGPENTAILAPCEVCKNSCNIIKI